MRIGRDGAGHGTWDTASGMYPHAPERLNERCGRRASPNHVLLALLLLHFERESAAQNALRTAVHTDRFWPPIT